MVHQERIRPFDYFLAGVSELSSFRWVSGSAYGLEKGSNYSKGSYLWRIVGRWLENSHYNCVCVCDNISNYNQSIFLYIRYSMVMMVMTEILYQH